MFWTYQPHNLVQTDEEREFFIKIIRGMDDDWLAAIEDKPKPQPGDRPTRPKNIEVQTPMSTQLFDTMFQ